jgi:putative mRNA 3-end processing factor
MKLRILGGGQEVGRSAIELDMGEESLLLDCGVNFDEKDRPRLPLQTSPRKLKGIVVTHGHLDHIGSLPLYQISTSVPVYGTRMTKLISEVILKDFLRLSGAVLPFEWVEVKKTMDFFHDMDYGEEFEVGGFKVEMRNAGHIPGSSLVTVKTSKGDVSYSGDINYTSTRLSNPADLSLVKETRVFVIESTYGKFNHPPRWQVEEEFYQSVREVVEGGGAVLVPAFSLARSQEILSLLAERDFQHPVYYDGMVKEMTRLMLDNPSHVAKYDSLRKAYENFYGIKGWQDRHKAWKGRGVIVTGAGMLKGGPAVYYYKKMSDNPRNAVFLVGYQAEGTPGRKILEEGKFDEQSAPLKARLGIFDFSSHAGRDQLVEILSNAKNLEKVVIVHGSPDSAFSLAETVRAKLGVEVISPQVGQEIEI